MQRRGYLYVVLCVVALTPSALGQTLLKPAAFTRTNPLHIAGYVLDGSSVDNKVDPALRYLVARYEAAVKSDGQSLQLYRRLRDGSLYFRLFGDGASDLTNSSLGEPEVQVFVKIASPAGVADLAAHGARILNVFGEIVVARLPVTKIDEFSSLDEIVSIQVPGRSLPLLNVSRVETKVDAVHAGSGGLPSPYKGTGVIVGIVDSGIDWKHPDFSVHSGNSRIQWILDYANGSPINGQEWTKAQIDESPSPVTEIDGPGGGGHGTHVTGIAAGGGKQNAGYIGMAPQSDIIFVKGIRDQNSSGGFDDADVLNGVAYIFGKATQVGRPAAVNLSLGGHFGPHDGTSLYEQGLSSLVRAGRIIVAAAGNDGSTSIHLSYSAGGTDFDTGNQTLWLVSTGSSMSAVDLWYASGSISVGIAAYLYDSSSNQLTLLGYTNPVAPGQSISDAPFTVNSITLARVTVDARTTSDPNNNAKRVLTVIESDGQSDISSVVWSLYTFGNGTFDAWTVTGGSFTADSDPAARIMPADDNKTVAIPATAKKVVCVGSYATKSTWTDIDGNGWQQQGVTIGSISSFSSRGPSRDGRAKPDLVAPGEVIFAALSADAGAERATILQGGGLLKNQGTSMAAPHVTGIVALMLERNKFLTYESVYALLTGAATAAGPANTYGAGKVHALNTFLATPAGVDCATMSKLTGYDCEGNRIAAYELLNAYPNPFNPSTTITFRLSKAEHTELAIYDLLGRHIRTLHSEVVSEGLHAVEWDGKNDAGREMASGIYYYRLSTPGFNATHRVVLLK